MIPLRAHNMDLLEIFWKKKIINLSSDLKASFYLYINVCAYYSAVINMSFFGVGGALFQAHHLPDGNMITG